MLSNDISKDVSNDVPKEPFKISMIVPIMPIIDKNDDGLWRRIRVLQFQNKFQKLIVS